MYFISCVSLKLCFKDWSTLATFWCDNWVRKTFPQYRVAQRSNAKLLSTFGSESYDTFPTSRHSFVQNSGSNKSPKHAIYKVSTCKWLEPRGATLLSLCPSLNRWCKKTKQRKHPRDDIWLKKTQSDKLTFMQPRRLARSMTRNFLMRSLGRGKKIKSIHWIQAVFFVELCHLSVFLSPKMEKPARCRAATDEHIPGEKNLTVLRRGDGHSAGWVVTLWQSLNQKEREHSPGLTKPPARVMRGGSGGDLREARVSALLRNRGLLMNVSESLS